MQLHLRKITQLVNRDYRHIEGRYSLQRTYHSRRKTIMVEIRQYKIHIECMIQSESVKTPESLWKGNIEETGAGTGGKWDL